MKFWDLIGGLALYRLLFGRSSSARHSQPRPTQPQYTPLYGGAPDRSLSVPDASGYDLDDPDEIQDRIDELEDMLSDCDNDRYDDIEREIETLTARAEELNRINDREFNALVGLDSDDDIAADYFTADDPYDCADPLDDDDPSDW